MITVAAGHPAPESAFGVPHPHLMAATDLLGPGCRQATLAAVLVWQGAVLVWQGAHGCLLRIQPQPDPANRGDVRQGEESSSSTPAYCPRSSTRPTTGPPCWIRPDAPVALHAPTEVIAYLASDAARARHGAAVIVSVLS